MTETLLLPSEKPTSFVCGARMVFKDEYEWERIEIS